MMGDRMNQPDIAEVVAITLAVGGALLAAGRWVFAHFHATQVKPLFAEMMHALSENTTATASLTGALAKTDEVQRVGQAENRQAFERMGEILHDHETRITVIERTRPNG